PLPETLLFQPYSSDPLPTVDLTKWQNRLGVSTAHDILQRNARFSGLILREIRKDAPQVCKFIKLHFGNIVVELDVSLSKMIDDNCLSILSTCETMRRLNVSGCPNVTDAGVKSVARKKATALQGLDVSNCQRVTDDSVEVLARCCPSLCSLILSGCPKVRDRSLFAMSALHGLQNIGLAGCNEITDKAARQLLTNLTQLKSLNINGCTSLTNEGLHYMYRTDVPWGVKRHQGCAQLTVLQISDNGHVSDELVAVLTSVCPLISCLELVNCPLLGGEGAMGKMGGLTHLTCLVLKGLRRVNDYGVEEFFASCPRRSLTYLDLQRCTRVADGALKFIAKYARNLRELRLDCCISVTDRGLASLSKGCTLLHTLQATHLGMITDIGVQLISRKCTSITDLDISYCIRLSGGIISVLCKLHTLENLGVCGCPGIDNASLTDMKLSQLKCLRIADNPQLCDPGIRDAVARNILLVSLDLSNCTGTTSAGLADILKSLPEITHVDLTGCTSVGPSELLALAHTFPISSLCLTPACLDVDGFHGLHCAGDNRDERHQQGILKQSIREKRAAIMVQQVYRRYQCENENMEKEYKLHMELMRAAMTIQGLVMRCVASRRLHYLEMRRPRLLLSLSKWRKRTIEANIWDKACRHSDRTTAVCAIRDWRLNTAKEMIESSELGEKAVVFFEHHLVSSCLRAWKRYLEPTKMIEATGQAKAEAWRREHLRASLFHLWKGNTKETKQRREASIRAVVFQLPLHYENSMRQQVASRRAIRYHARHVKAHAWEAFLSLNIELADLHKRMKQYKVWHRPRLLQRTLCQLKDATVTSKWCRDAKCRADVFARSGKKRRVIQKLHGLATSRVTQRTSMAMALAFAKGRPLSCGLSCLRNHPGEKRVIKRMLQIWMGEGVRWRIHRLKAKGIDAMEFYMREKIRVKDMSAKAIIMSLHHRNAACFMAWKLHHCTIKSAIAACYQRRHRHLLRRTFLTWTAFHGKLDQGTDDLQSDLVSMKEASYRQLEAMQHIFHSLLYLHHIDKAPSWLATLVLDAPPPQISLVHVPLISLSAGKQQSTEQEGLQDGILDGNSSSAILVEATEMFPLEYIAAVACVQTVWRGWVARKDYGEKLILQEWAAVKIQSLFRARIARRIMSQKIRHKIIRQIVKEEQANEAMACSDSESHLLRVYIKGLDTLSRLVLGYKGRKIARARKKELHLEKATQRMHENEIALNKYQEKQRRLELLRNNLERTVTIIQAAVRGMIARIQVRELREDIRQNLAAIRIQCMVRFRGARLEAGARNRHRERLKYLGRSRKMQGCILRLAGLSQRKTQRPVIRLFQRFGVNLMSFTIDVKRQWADITRDKELARAEFLMCQDACRQDDKRGRDTHLMVEVFKSLQISALELKCVKRGDVVKIVQVEHDFCGYTGRVLHVDVRHNINAVAEVKLDDCSGRVVGVKMFTDIDNSPENNGLPEPNMVKIDKMELPQYKSHELMSVKDELLLWAERERGWWKNHLAAVRIQTQTRLYLARHYTARQRFKYYTQLHTCGIAVIQALDNTNTATYQETMAIFRLLKPSMVPKLIPWIPLKPPRLEEAVNCQKHRSIISAEIHDRMSKRRQAAMDGPHKMTWKTVTHGPIFRNHNPLKEEWGRLASGVSPSKLSKIFKTFTPRSLLENWDRWCNRQNVFTRAYTFEQFSQSPHMCTQGRALYHGAWGGRSKKAIVGSVPHGEGYAEFLDGWGVAQEEKTLYVTVEEARELPAMDQTMFKQSSDPFFVLKCNGRILRTATIYKTLMPRYNEQFEVPVTNSSATLLVECWDDDVIGKKFIGSINIPLQDLSDGQKVVEKWFPLGEDPKKGVLRRAMKGTSRGIVKLGLQWLPNKTEDDVNALICLEKAAITIQCWMRQYRTRKIIDDATEEVARKELYIFLRSRTIQMCFRRHNSREILRVKRCHYRNATIIQKYARRKLAYREIAIRRLQRENAIIIQTSARRYIARKKLQYLQEQRRILEHEMSIKIQAVARVMLARMEVATKLEEQGEDRDILCVEDWVLWYGTDPEYPSRRLRRITERVFRKILSTKGAVVETRFGAAKVEYYPARGCYSNSATDKGEPLRSVKQFLEVKWQAHADLRWPKKDLIKVFKAAGSNYYGILELGSVSTDRTVGRRVICIQCLVRQQQARTTMEKQKRTWMAATLIQKAARKRVSLIDKTVAMLQCMVRKMHARSRTAMLRHEVECALKIQLAFRQYKSRLVLDYKRVIQTTAVRNSSGCSDPLYKAENCLVLDSPDEPTLWTSPYGEVEGQWIEFDLSTDKPVGVVRFLAMANTACPKQASASRL
ncbi:unnamed protein product, partial [Choristocarpus tenellus]